MMFHLSDWPETGLPAPWITIGASVELPRLDADAPLERRGRCASGCLRLVSGRNGFESELYGRPVRDLRLLAQAVSPAGSDRPAPIDPTAVAKLASDLLSSPECRSALLYTKVVLGEPLHQALQWVGFTTVEERQVYGCRVRDLDVPRDVRDPDELRYCTLVDIPEESRANVRTQLLELSAVAFASGHSRHFRDASLFAIVPGRDYIIAAMRRNFALLPPTAFLLAMDPARQAVVGFTVIGSKPGLRADVRTQLLSAVRPDFQRRGIYYGLTRLLRRTLEPETLLLNVTHAGSSGMQRAYERTGRTHIATSLVLRAPRAAPVHATLTALSPRS